MSRNWLPTPMLRRSLHPSSSPLSRVFRVCAVCLILFSAGAFVFAPANVARLAHAQDATPTSLPVPDSVAAIIARMSVQQRVGQIFTVSFSGAFPISATTPTEEIIDLITTYRIGGVQLRAGNRNFDNSLVDPPVTQQIAHLTNALQASAVLTGASPLDVIPTSPTRIAPTGEPTATVTPTPTIAANAPPPAIPLFIAVSQDADTMGRAEQSEVTQGLTPLPARWP